MASEILHAWGPGESRLALVRDGRLVDLAVVRPELLAGAVVLGRVVEVAGKIGAVFVDIGQDRPGFLQGVKLAQGTAVLVQVKADAQGLKGDADHRAALTGRFLSYTPFRPGLAVSRKLAEDRRTLLVERLEALMQPGEGVVARLHAVNADVALAADLAALRAQWQAVRDRQKEARPPQVLWRPDPLDRMLADHPGVSRVVVDDDLTFAQAQARYGTMVARHRDGSAFSLYDAEDAFAACLDPVVPLPCGGRVTIQPTAALVAIDVDSGGAAAIEATQAVSVIARQLRLATCRPDRRRLRLGRRGQGRQGGVDEADDVAETGGVVRSDRHPRHRRHPLGLVEMTRERLRPSLAN